MTATHGRRDVDGRSLRYGYASGKAERRQEGGDQVSHSCSLSLTVHPERSQFPNRRSLLQAAVSAPEAPVLPASGATNSDALDGGAHTGSRVFHCCDKSQGQPVGGSSMTRRRARAKSERLSTATQARPAHFPRQWKASDVSRVIALYRRGLTYGQIAIRFGVTRCAIAGVIHRHSQGAKGRAAA